MGDVQVEVLERQRGVAQSERSDGDKPRDGQTRVPLVGGQSAHMQLAL